MKSVLVLVLLLSTVLCAAFAAPAEDQQHHEEVLKEEAAAAPETMAEEESLVPGDSVPAPRDAGVSEEGAAPEARFNFCPAGWLSLGTRCFLFVNTAKTWFSAEEHCNNLGGHLASVKNGQEYLFLQQVTQMAGQSVAWLGGFRLQTTWMWIDREGFYYNNWYSQSSSVSYPCLYLSTAYGWRNTQCTSSLRFICAKNPFGC